MQDYGIACEGYWGATVRSPRRSTERRKFYPMAKLTICKKRQLVAAFVITILCVSTVWAQTPASKPNVGRIIGNIDGISHDGGQFFIAGWACQQGRSESIQLHIFAGADPAKKEFLTARQISTASQRSTTSARIHSRVESAGSSSPCHSDTALTAGFSCMASAS